MGLTLAVTHAFVYARGGAGSERPWSDFLRYSLVGYALALAVSVSALWIFERLGGLGLAAVLEATVALGFPAALGAAASRLIL